MILYFSATGNSKFAAQQIADAVNDRIRSITEAGNEIILPPGEALGFVTPTYFYGLPSNVEAFLKSLRIECNSNHYIYCVATCGGTSGQASKLAAELLEQKGLTVNACFDIVMPDNWTPMCDVSDAAEIRKMLEAEKPQLAEIITHIRNRDSGNYAKHTTPMFVSKFAHIFYGPSRKTSHLTVESGCIGCGLCAKNCPVQAIEMRSGEPVWIKDQCAMCLGCLHNCPKFAIQYRKNTKKHGQYTHP